MLPLDECLFAARPDPMADDDRCGVVVHRGSGRGDQATGDEFAVDAFGRQRQRSVAHPGRVLQRVRRAPARRG